MKENYKLFKEYFDKFPIIVLFFEINIEQANTHTNKDRIKVSSIILEKFKQE
jgi:hypothetical protein